MWWGYTTEDKTEPLLAWWLNTRGDELLKLVLLDIYYVLQFSNLILYVDLVFSVFLLHYNDIVKIWIFTVDIIFAVGISYKHNNIIYVIS